LHDVSVRCARRDVDWLFIGGRPVRRIVAICDPDAELPLADGRRSGAEELDVAQIKSWSARSRHVVALSSWVVVMANPSVSRSRPEAA
jgi:hypothetical protein